MLHQPLHDEDVSVVFMYSGQGGQFPGMARELYESEPGFREDLDHMDDAGLSVLGRRFLPAMYERGEFNDVLTTHLAIFAVQRALTRLLSRRGVHPDYVLGMSVGEFAAMVAAGILPHEDALHCLLQQAAVLARSDVAGGMMAVAGLPSIFWQVSPLARHCELALVSARHFVAAGDASALGEAAARLRDQAIAHWRLPVTTGFHSRLIDPCRGAYVRAVSGTTGSRARVPYVSCSAGWTSDGAECAGQLWRAIRDPIRFAEAARAVSAFARHVYVDLGPGGVAANLLRHNGIDMESCHAPVAPQSDPAQVLAQLTSA